MKWSKFNQKNPIRKWAKTYGQTFQRKGYTDGKEALEKASSSLPVREMQIGTTVEYHYTPGA